MAARSLSELIAPDWAEALRPVAPAIAGMGDFLRAEIAAGRSYLPAGENILRAFRQPMADVRVLIVGQDPYPTPGHPVGLSFSVAPEVRRLPGSLVNIFNEYTADLGHPRPATGDLTAWSERGVMLLNRVLTVQPGKPASHRGKGWEPITEQAIRSLAARGGPLVAICSATFRRFSPPTRARCRLTAASSGRGRSAAPMPCCSSRAASRSTGSFLSKGTPQAGAGHEPGRHPAADSISLPVASSNASLPGGPMSCRLAGSCSRLRTGSARAGKPARLTGLVHTV
jgi:uracil-DNA glycosylase